MSPNLKAFLDTIAVSELGPQLIKISDNGYNVNVGSTPAKPILFKSYAAHPRIRVPSLNSDAAGRYQLMGRYYLPYKTLLRLPDFSPASQDAIAIQQIKERRALPDIEAGRFAAAIAKTTNIWASFPGNSYGQHQHPLTYLQEVYARHGGSFS